MDITPFWSAKTNDWRMRVKLTSEVLEKLEQVPGLGMVMSENMVRGQIDAIVVACAILKREHFITIFKYAGENVKSKLPLKQYQKAGVETLREIISKYGGALLADDMGLGKTLQTIALANEIESPRNLVAAPRSLSFNWQEELVKWGEMDHVVLTPGDTKRHKANWEKAKKAKWVISSYELMSQVMERCYQSQLPWFLIFDEAHMVKNLDSQRGQFAKDLATMVPYKLAITATPMWNRPRDFYGILKVILGDRFGSRTAFFKRYCGGMINAHGGLEARGATHEEELKGRLAHYMVRREKKEVAKELPSLTRQVIWIESDPEATRAFKASILNKRKSAWYLAVKAAERAKIPVVLELALQAKRFLLLTHERETAQELSGKLQLMGIPNHWIHGGLSAEERQKRVGAARRGGWSLVGTLDSLGVGLNLQGIAATGIMHTIDPVPLKAAQAEARIHRLGQTKNVIWYYPALRESQDEILVKLNVEKLDQWRAIIGHDSNRSLRDDLSDSKGGTEEDALSAIFEALEAKEG